MGEIVKLLKELNALYEYDIILFNVSGDVVPWGSEIEHETIRSQAVGGESDLSVLYLTC